MSVEPVSDPDMILYEILPFTPTQANRIIQHLCVLAGLDVGQAGDDPECAERVRQAFGLIVDAARARQALLDLNTIEGQIGRSPWRDLLGELRHERGRFATAIRDKSARIALRWALRDLGQAGRARRRWLHCLRDSPAMLRKTIDRALDARMLQRDAGRTDRVDRVVLVQGVSRAWQLLDGRSLGRSLTAEGRPSGPGLRLVPVSLEPLDPLVTDDAMVWAIRRAQTQGRGGRVKVDQAPAQDTEAAAQPAQASDLAPDVEEKINALVRLLARQAAREHFDRLTHHDSEDPTDEGSAPTPP